MKKIRKILLITPPYHSGVVESAGVWMNVGFVYIAGSLRAAGYDPFIYDAMSYWHGYEDIQKKITDLKPDVVATTAFTAEIVDALKVLKLARDINPEIITVIGNVHPTFCYEEIFKDHHMYVDYVVCGEGENVIVDLMNALSQGADISKVKGIAYREGEKVEVTLPGGFIKDLDSLPTAWDLIDWPIYTYRPVEDSRLAVVSSSRGCTQQCTFCSQQLFWQRSWRGRTAENFVGELEYLRNTYGVNIVMISDETPTLDRRRWEKILDLLIERKVGTKILMETRVDDIIRDEDIMWKYKKANIDHIYVGVEATTQETLDIFKKDIKVEQSKKALDLINSYNIVSETSFVLGMPDDTAEKIKHTVELAKYYNPDLAFFLAIAPWPYSEIYPMLKPYIEIFDYSKYNLVEPVVKPREMTINEVRKELGHASRDFYMHKMRNLDSMTPEKQEFMIKVMKLISTNSYLAEHMQGEMPEEIKRILSRMKK
ncbi:MAG: magnesium-protoporphyrin IX monomethyl ester oxidative cyclase [Nitrospirae bacterium GWC2_42_7]|nr:MAG: magnesium-protoporphyrin IX monomethyl ester oxidative cyclase [Nitrospirae bacterium GWC2_42_7]